MSDMATTGSGSPEADAFEDRPSAREPDDPRGLAQNDPNLAGDPVVTRRRRGFPVTSDAEILDAAARKAVGDGPSRRIQAARALANGGARQTGSAGGGMQNGRTLDTVPAGRRLQQSAPQNRPARREGGRGAQVGAGTAPVRMKHAERSVVDLDELWAPVRTERVAADREFLPGALEILEAPASPIRVRLIYALCGLVAAALAWSWFGHLDVYADATGKVQASGRTKVVQPIVSGKVDKILATDGDQVKAGAVLVQLDPTAATAERNIVRDQLFNARSEVVRHRAEIAALSKSGVDTAPKVDWPKDLPKNVIDREAQAMGSELSSLAADLSNLQAQRAATVADRDKYQANIEPQKKVIDLIQEHLGMRDALFKDGWNSRATVLEQEQQLQTAQLQLVNLQGSLGQANAAIPVIDSKIDVTRQTFITTHTTSLVQAQQQVDKLTEDLSKAEENLEHMTLTSPIDGVVQATAVTTVGQVVTTGQQLMQIVPKGTPLEIEAYVLNTDAGFLHVGQDATIKVDTYPYTRYGTLSGKVTKVAADALTGKQAKQQQSNGSAPPSADGAMSITSAAQQTTDLVFPVTVVPDQPGLWVDGRLLPLTSGMTVTVEVRTESRRAIDYILSPLQAMFEQSAQER
jgi:hemolysin D